MNRRILGLLIIVISIYIYQRNADVDKTPAPTQTAQVESADSVEILEKPIPTVSTLVTAELQPTAEQIELRKEGKSVLGAAYTSMAVIHAEFDRYSSDLMSEFIPEGEILEMKAGFLEVYQPQQPFEQENPQRKDTDFFVQASLGSDSPVRYSESAEKIDLQSLAQFCDKKCEASEREFEYVVAINLDEDPELDVWTINERKEIIHRFDDVTNQLQK